MTEYSFVWGGIATGDATSAPYTDDQWATLWSVLHQYDRTTQGPLITNFAGYTGGLELTNPSGTTMRVASGAGIVDGRLYLSSANIDTDVNNGGTGYYNVVLQKLEAAQTVRVAFLGPEVGVPTVTQDANTWEISLGTFHFNDSTNTVSALTDTRVFCEYPGNSAPVTKEIWFPARAPSTGGGAFGSSGGVALDDSSTEAAVFTLAIPNDFVSDAVIKVIGGSEAFGVFGNVYVQYSFACSRMDGTETVTHETLSGGPSAVSVSDFANSLFGDISYANAQIGDLVRGSVTRVGGNGADTMSGDYHVLGLILEYTGRR